VIASVRGLVAAVQPTGVVVEVGGVGLSLQCTPTTVASLRVGEDARLATSLVVREDSLTLYGFADEDERGVFELLQTASGVGPRLAQAMLAVHTPEALRRAVASADAAALTQVPGIGRKGAQRILLELRDRLGPPEGGGTASLPATSGQAAWRAPLVQALEGLGWSTREAEEAATSVVPEAARAEADGGTPNVATLLRAALRSLNRA
jgi:holliday junction DNA helicase RuvA